MTLTNGKQPIRREEQAKFLERDFSECFAQLRHYDGQIWDICKFTFVSYTTVLAVAIGLYEYSLDKGVNLRPVAIAVLAASSLLGIFMLCLTVRNRLYFVLVTRYVNEHRGHFLEGKPLGFQNRAGMYTDPTKPQFYNWRSSQLWLTSIVAVLNAALLTVMVAMVLQGYQFRWCAVVATAIVSLVAQLFGARVYLTSREGKSGERAAFGEEKR